jgi:hypothetical protein
MENRKPVPTVVLDTNVLYEADNLSDRICQKACFLQVEAIQKRRKQLAVDTYGYIMEEYARNTKNLDNTSVRKQFVNWLRSYLYTQCLRVDPQPIDNSGTNFKLFPSDSALEGFHLDDKKFVAVAIAAQQTLKQTVPILNAVDTDWCDYRAALLQHGVVVRFLCPHRMPSDECR